MQGGQRYALPLDACVQMLFYRKDLFEDELIKREFFELHHRRLEVPGTFSTFDELARFFTRSLHSSSVSRYGCTETFGRAVLAACDFLPAVGRVWRDWRQKPIFSWMRR